VDDRDVVEQAYVDVVRSEISDRDRPCGLLEEAGAIDQRAVRVGADEVVGEDLVESLNVAVLDRVDVVAVEGDQRLQILCLGGGHGPDDGSSRPAR